MRNGNIKTLHHRGGIIKFIVNGENRFEQIYISKKHRSSIIKYFKRYYKNDFVIEIKPNWDIWNGKF